MECRKNCGACCIVPSISSAIPGMPGGKPAGVACIHLSDDNRCLIYGQTERPKVCRDFAADSQVCGTSRAEAMILLQILEDGTFSSGSP